MYPNFEENSKISEVINAGTPPTDPLYDASWMKV